MTNHDLVWRYWSVYKETRKKEKLLPYRTLSWVIETISIIFQREVLILMLLNKLERCSKFIYLFIYFKAPHSWSLILSRKSLSYSNSTDILWQCPSDNGKVIWDSFGIAILFLKKNSKMKMKKKKKRNKICVWFCVFKKTVILKLKEGGRRRGGGGNAFSNCSSWECFFEVAKKLCFHITVFHSNSTFHRFYQMLNCLFPKSVFNATFEVAIFSKSHFQTVNPNGHLLLFPLMVAMNQVLDISLCVWISWRIR